MDVIEDVTRRLVSNHFTSTGQVIDSSVNKYLLAARRPDASECALRTIIFCGHQPSSRAEKSKRTTAPHTITFSILTKSKTRRSQDGTISLTSYSWIVVVYVYMIMVEEVVC